MTATYPSPTSTSAALHPLEPLSADEILEALAILRAQQNLSDRVRFVSIALQEPPKSVVLSFKLGMTVERQAFVIVLDNVTGNTYEAIVSLNQSVSHFLGPYPRRAACDYPR